MKKVFAYTILNGMKHDAKSLESFFLCAGFLGVLLIAFTPSIVLGYGNTGTSGAAFLELPIGARPIAMGEAYTAGTDDVNVLYYNPAGLATLQFPSLSLFHNELFLDSRFENITAAIPFQKGYLGFATSMFWVPPFEKIDENGNSNGTVQFYNSATTVAFGRQVGPVLLGGSLKYIFQKIDTMTTNAVALDLGIQKQLYMYTPFTAPIRNFTVGASFLNLGTPVKGYPLPRTFHLGASYMPTKWAKINVDMSEYIIDSSDLYDFTYGFDESFHLNTGFELTWQDMLYLRGGYRFNSAGKYSIGLGFNYTFSDVAFTVDTSYSDGGIFGPVYAINLIFKLIPKIITSEDKKKAEKFYQDGIRYYVGDDLDSSIQAFRKSRDFNPYQRNINDKIQDLEELQRLREQNKKYDEDDNQR
ncbi:MAG TPA: PorV/PorQ family protein [Spirochaetota bacterium]